MFSARPRARLDGLPELALRQPAGRSPSASRAALSALAFWSRGAPEALRSPSTRRCCRRCVAATRPHVVAASDEAAHHAFLRKLEISRFGTRSRLGRIHPAMTAPPRAARVGPRRAAHHDASRRGGHRRRRAGRPSVRRAGKLVNRLARQCLRLPGAPRDDRAWVTAPSRHRWRRGDLPGSHPAFPPSCSDDRSTAPSPSTWIP